MTVTHTTTAATAATAVATSTVLIDQARLREALRLRSRLAQHCYGAGIRLSLSTESHYWLLEYTDGTHTKPRRAEWWPLSARLVFEGKYKRAETAETVDAVWEAVVARWSVIETRARTRRPVHGDSGPAGETAGETAAIVEPSAGNDSSEPKGGAACVG